MRGGTLHGCVLAAARQLSQMSSLKGGDSRERPSSPKTLEAIDEYQRSFELTVDDRRELTVLRNGSSHHQIGLGMIDAIAIETQIEVG